MSAPASSRSLMNERRRSCGVNGATFPWRAPSQHQEYGLIGHATVHEGPSPPVGGPEQWPPLIASNGEPGIEGQLRPSVA